MPAQRLVVSGHLGFESVRTPIAERRSLGGSGCYTALGAALSGGSVAIVVKNGERGAVYRRGQESVVSRAPGSGVRSPVGAVGRVPGGIGDGAIVRRRFPDQDLQEAEI